MGAVRLKYFQDGGVLPIIPCIMPYTKVLPFLRYPEFYVKNEVCRA